MNETNPYWSVILRTVTVVCFGIVLKPLHRIENWPTDSVDRGFEPNLRFNTEL